MIFILLTVMASGRVRTGIRPGTDRHLSGPRSGRSGFGGIRSIPRLPHRSVPKSSRSMSVLDHGHTGSGRSSMSQISEKSRSGTRASQDRPGFYYVDVTHGAVTGKWLLANEICISRYISRYIPIARYSSSMST